MKSIPVAPGVVTQVGPLEVCHNGASTAAALVDEETGIVHLPPVVVWSVRPLAEAGDRSMIETADRAYRFAIRASS